MLFALVCLTLPLGAAAKPSLVDKANLTIIADSSLMLPMADISRIYAQKTGTPLTVVREESSDPSRQIEQGFDAHILLSADPTLVERLAQRGLIDVFGTQSFARTQLALIAPTRMKAKLSLTQHISFAAMLFSQPDLPIYINAITTPGGLRAQALMEGREFSHELSTRAVIKTDRREVYDTLRKNDGFALVLASAAVAEPGISILSLLPENTSEAIRYDAVVLASDSMEQSRAFTEFLRSDEAQAIFSHYGFQPPPQEKN